MTARATRVLWLLGAFCAVATARAADQPEALLNFERARSGLRTGEVVYSYERWIERPEQAPLRSFRHFTARVANADRINTNRGDEEGYQVRMEDGSPPPAAAQLNWPEHMLFTGGRIWKRDENRESGALYEEGRPNNLVLDPRTLGVNAATDYRSLGDVLWVDMGDKGPRRYEERVEDGLHVVTADTSDGNRYEWWIDPSRGWNAVRVRYTSQRGWKESRTTLKQSDGVWFPEKVEHYASYWKGGAEPCETYRVFSARFNRPGDQQSFTPADIGITEDMFISTLDLYHQEVHRGFYHGGRIVPEEDYFAERVAKAAANKTEPTGDPLAYRAKIDAAARFESEWEAYTRKFIERYKLSEDQAQKAQQILRDCQSSARSYLDRQKSRMEKLHRDLAAIGKPATPEQKARAVALGETIDRLCRPVDQIFERQLKPRLDSLPTRKQRAEAGDAAPASRPTSRP